MAQRLLGSGGAVALLFACSAVCAPAALAVPPANDDFAGRELLNGSLPIEVSRSNVAATKEEGEYIPGPPAPAGHSVWFEWEATSSDFVTIGACDDAFPTILAIFTGTELGSLNQVASGNADEGPDCPYSGRQYTFKTVSGTKYVIAVDGNFFHLPEAPTPVTEGDIVLRIEETPPPPNDDFIAAETLESRFEEEYEGEVFYWGSAFGYNWNATEETGEFNHIGGPHGASVWYSWTPPVSGDAKISAGFFSDHRLGVYAGDSLQSLQLMLGGLGPAGGAGFIANAGTTYRIAVYGLLDEPGGAAEMSSFQFNISLRAPVPAAANRQKEAATPPAPDLTPPQTTIGERTVRPRKRSAAFSFRSNEPGGSFRCQLDARNVTSCLPPQAYRHLKPGSHVFKVAAVDAAGNVDPSPAVAQFKVPRSKQGPAKAEPQNRAPPVALDLASPPSTAAPRPAAPPSSFTPTPTAPRSPSSSPSASTTGRAPSAPFSSP